ARLIERIPGRGLFQRKHDGLLDALPVEVLTTTFFAELGCWFVGFRMVFGVVNIGGDAGGSGGKGAREGHVRAHHTDLFYEFAHRIAELVDFSFEFDDTADSLK